MNIQPHQQRVVDEKAELDGRLDKLLPFIDGPVFASLDHAEQGRLTRQAALMRCLSNLLGERIAAFQPAAPSKQAGFADLIVLAIIAAAVAGVLAGAAWWLHRDRAEQFAAGEKKGRGDMRAEWDAAIHTETLDNILETKRRTTAQERNQREQNEQLAAARAAADRNARDAERLRNDNATAARDWSTALRNSPTPADLEAASAAIGVLTDLLGRADRRAGVLATYATAAHAAGLKCERDYDALSLTPSPTTTER